MEHRDNGLLVDFSAYDSFRDTGQRVGGKSILQNTKQEAEMQTLDQETRLMRAMNEIRACSPKSMTPQQRDLFRVMCEGIFAKHGITEAQYQEMFGHLGTKDQLHR